VWAWYSLARGESVRPTSSRLAVALLATVTVAAGSWLLLAEPTLGRTRDEQSARTKRTVRPQSHGYGGYSGVCTPAALRPLSAPEAFARRGKVRCFASSGNPSGDNADLSTDVFVADEEGTVVNMTKDTFRCVEGPNNAKSCATEADCPQGSCQDTSVLACATDGSGRLVYFIFDGNPTGQNADLSDELFVFDRSSGQLTQLTTQRGWCNDDPSQACDRSSDCASGTCARARMQGTRRYGGYGRSFQDSANPLEVSPDGDFVWFVTDGDPGGNPNHAVTQFVLVRRGAAKGFRVAGSAGKFCDFRTKHPGMPCTAASDCGPVCGDGRVDPGEECEPFLSPPTCPTGKFCQFPGRPNECTCVSPVCGNGIREPGEVCDGPGKFCLPPQHCNSTCTACLPASTSGGFLDPAP